MSIHIHNSSQGWIYLPRSLFQTDFWVQSSLTAKLTGIYLLVFACYQESTFGKLKIERGQLFRTITDLAEDLDIDRKTCRRSISELEQLGYISVHHPFGLKKGLLITVVDYDTIQSDDIQNSKLVLSGNADSISMSDKDNWRNSTEKPDWIPRGHSKRTRDLIPRGDLNLCLDLSDSPRIKFLDQTVLLMTGGNSDLFRPILRLMKCCERRQSWSFKDLNEDQLAAYCKFDGDASSLWLILEEAGFIWEKCGSIHVSDGFLEDLEYLSEFTVGGCTGL